jgi:adenine phosphoribosyltransferase
VEPDLDRLIKDSIRDVPDYPKPGILFKDITPLLASPGALERVAGGLRAGFVPVRKQGKLPSATYTQTYDLEYGTATIEVHTDAFAPGDRVLIVDDVLATGGTARAAADLVRQAGAEVAGISVLLELGFLAGRANLAGLPFRTILQV